MITISPFLELNSRNTVAALSLLGESGFDFFHCLLCFLLAILLHIPYVKKTRNWSIQSPSPPFPIQTSHFGARNYRNSAGSVFQRNHFPPLDFPTPLPLPPPSFPKIREEVEGGCNPAMMTLTHPRKPSQPSPPVGVAAKQRGEGGTKRKEEGEGRWKQE